MLSKTKFITIFLMVMALIASKDVRSLEKTTPKQVTVPIEKKTDTPKHVMPAVNAVLVVKEVKVPSRKLDHCIYIRMDNPAAKNTNPWYKDILPVITLVLGLLLKELIDGWGNIKRTKKIGKRWKTELEILIKPLERQVEEIQKAIDHRQANPNEPPKLVSIASLECENFESLDKSELLTYINRYFINDYKEAVSLTGQINLQISIIKSNSLLLKDTFFKGLEEIGKRNDKLNANFQELLHALHVYKNTLINKGGKEALYSDKFRTLDELYGVQVLPHLEDGKFDYRTLDREYFTPMIKELDRLSDDTDTHQMATVTRKCLDNVMGIQMESLYLTTNLANLMHYFQQSKTDLQKVLESLDPTRKLFKII
ncbi:hypothetical protein [Pedobacter sp. N23S346]|uniref:hypothetical protein n=1 Tax=Pedobacter sp. N23S346 TaxID=3402750 RepID=UPI003ACB8A5F